MEIVSVRYLDQIHKIHSIEKKKNLQTEKRGLGETDEETNNFETRQCMAGYVEACV